MTTTNSEPCSLCHVDHHEPGAPKCKSIPATDEMKIPVGIEQQRIDRNDLSYWFPILEKTGVPVPRTTIIRTQGPIYPAAYGEITSPFETLIEDLKTAAESYTYPFFLRTGHGSGKHYWRDTCFVQRPEDIRHHVLELIEWSELVDFVGLPTEVWCVREMLSLEIGFTAFSGRMPVNKERRWFFKNGRDICHHPYWPEGAIEGHDADRDDWKEVLAQLNHERNEEEVDQLRKLTLQVAGAFDGAWSLDWACTADGVWYAIDMATAHTSYHDEACPHAEELRTRG